MPRVSVYVPHEVVSRADIPMYYIAYLRLVIAGILKKIVLTYWVRHTTRCAVRTRKGDRKTKTGCAFCIRSAC